MRSSSIAVMFGSRASSARSVIFTAKGWTSKKRRRSKLHLHSGDHRVLVDAFEKALGEGERAASLVACDERGLSFARGFEEEFDLGAQRLNVNDVEVSDLNAGPRTRRRGRREAADGGVAR